MPARSSLNVSLTAELEKFVQERVKSGKYQTASEVVRDALRLLEAREQTYQVALSRVKAKLQRGIAQAERGDLVDGEEFFDKLISRLERKRRRSRAA